MPTGFIVPGNRAGLWALWMSKGHHFVMRPCLALRQQAPALVPTSSQPLARCPPQSFLFLPHLRTGRGRSGRATFQPGWPFSALVVSRGETSWGTPGHQDPECSKSLPLSPLLGQQGALVSNSSSAYTRRYCTISLPLIFAYLTTVFN